MNMVEDTEITERIPLCVDNECPKNFLRSDSFRAPQTPYQENGSDEITQTN